MNISDEEILYRYQRIHGYGESYFIPNIYFAGATDLGTYKTYFDFVRDFHDNYWPLDQAQPEDLGEFDILSHDLSYHNIIYKNISCVLITFNAAEYIMSEAYDNALGEVINTLSCKEEDMVDKWYREQSYLLAAKNLNKNDDWCVIPQLAEQHEDELIIIFSSQRAMKQIRLDHFMEDIEIMLTPADALNTEIINKTKEAKHFLNLIKPNTR